MKLRQLLLLLLVSALAAAGGWLAARRHPPGSKPAAAPAANGPRVLYYQSSMHPWIKSDQPGRCTICGMELVPVYEGQSGFEAGAGIVTLSSNIIQVIGVQTEEVQRRPLRRQFRFAGIIEDNDTKHRYVSAYIDGRIDELAVNYVGAEVRAGQPLATFYSPILLAAEREYVSLQRQQPEAVSAALTQERRFLLETAALRLRRLGLTDAQIAQLPSKNDQELHTQILAPVSGTITARNVYPGQYVKEGDKLFELADFSTMWFVFDAYERDLSWLKPGQRVEITMPAMPGQTLTGAIAFIDPNLNGVTRSAKVRVELPNPRFEDDGRSRRLLYHRLYADASVQVESPEVLSVSRSAILSPGAQALAYVEKGPGAYEQRRIRLGRAGDEAWEVLEGLQAGERVVTTGNLLVDAQAQLNASAALAPASGPPPASTPAGSAPGSAPALPPLTDGQRQAVTNFLNLVAAITDVLASDDLAGFNTRAAQTHQQTPALLNTFKDGGAWLALVQQAEPVGHLEPADNLRAARKSFHPLSEVAVQLVKALRGADAAFRSLHVYRCPMTKDSFPGAPRTAEWIQLAAPIRNPYFGAEMLDCGSEVK